ncbi:transposase [Thiorhodovibrio winogradskyi]|uniref:transposase n=1 Tax=Thiorhodovibrio winogradskyi TaxID=77007 RepID=UPI002E2D0DE5|nr:transposase [Thiorhodovibrio winogradskyi]
MTDDAETLKRWKFRLMRLMYDRGHERALIEEVLRLIDWMIRLPAALEAEFRQELYAYEEQRQMPYVTTFEQAGIQKGEATILMMLLEEKFGSASLEAHRERISAADPEELLQWSKRILTAETPETIFH